MFQLLKYILSVTTDRVKSTKKNKKEIKDDSIGNILNTSSSLYMIINCEAYHDFHTS